MFDNTHTRHFSTIPNFNTSVYDHVHLCELGTFILSSSKIVKFSTWSLKIGLVIGIVLRDGEWCHLSSLEFCI
jgi:hypothetical protein